MNGNLATIRMRLEFRQRTHQSTALHQRTTLWQRRSPRQSSNRTQLRRGTAMLSTLAILCGMLVAVFTVTPTPRAFADEFVCTDVYGLQGTGQRNIWHMDTDTGAQVVEGNLTGTGNANAMGISNDGQTAYFLRDEGNNTRGVWKWDSITNTSTRLGPGVDSADMTHGDVTADGFYYYGGIGTDGIFRAGGFDTNTNRSLGVVLRGPIPNTGRNGDWAFDDSGVLYIVAGGNGTNVLSVISQPLSRTPLVTPMVPEATELTRIPTETSNPLVGIAFGGDGYLYVAGPQAMYRIHPSNGVNLAKMPITTAGLSDLASCATPYSVAIMKNFPDGRAADNDQVTMTITNPNITRGNRETTTGNESGLQKEYAGPVLALPGDRIHIEETGAGAQEPAYARAWTCVDYNTGIEFASGEGSSGDFVIPSDTGDGVASVCTFVNTAQRPSVALTKSANTDELIAGNTITYSFLVTNTGNVPLSDIIVTEGTFSGSGDMSAITCPAEPASLPRDQSVTCTATYEVTQADVDRGVITNTATASGTPPLGSSVTSDPSSVRIPQDPEPGLSLVKSVDQNELVAGETLNYSFVVTNTGNVTLSDIGITETSFTGSGSMSAIVCPSGALAPSKQVTCTATYQVTQADVDAGTVENTATAQGTPPDSDEPISSDPSDVRIPEDPAPALSLVKSAAPSQGGTAGDTISYSFLVTNTGNVTLSDVGITEGAFSGTGELSEIVCPAEADALAPGKQVTCTAAYTLTQADVDAGTVTNTATASGQPPGDSRRIDSPPSEAEVPVAPAPALSLVKTVAPETGRVAGDTVTYSFVATNTGNVTLTDVTITEGEFSGSGELSALDCQPGAASLAPGDAVTCTASYTLTQADVDAGEITNTATAVGTPPGGGDPVPSGPADATVTVDPSPELELVKTAAPAEGRAVGDTITYSFVATNTGNVTLTDVTVTEGAFSGSGELSAINCPAAATSLAPGDSVTCSASYVLTQADVNSGQVTNTATAAGTPPGGGDPVPSEPATAEVPIRPAPAISIVKSVDRSELIAGQTATYSFTVTNTGNVTLTNVAVAEGEFTGAGELSEIVCPAGAASLAPGAEIICTATYEVTQADVDAGSVRNTATAGGTPPTGEPVTSDPSEARIPQEPAPSISLVKSADRTDLSAGDTVTYSFVVTNTGNVTLADIAVTEGEFTGSGTLSTIDCPADQTTLAPGGQLTCTATYEVTQADVDAGSVQNSATATGTPPSGDPVTSPPSAVELPQDPTPNLALIKSATPAQGGAVGDEIAYSFEVTNTGNVTLTDVAITETEFSGTGELSEIACPAAASELRPGQRVTCTASYTLTQADVDAGEVTNTATASGTQPNGDPVISPQADTEVPITPGPTLSLVKSVDPATGGAVGDDITYSFAVTNTGNVTLSDVTITETAFSGSGELSAIACPAEAASLAPGATVTCTAGYTLTQADIDAGRVTNTATASGTPPTGEPVTSPPADAEIPLAPAPALTLVKSADPAADGTVGDDITYSFAVTNTGNVTLSDVTINETAFSGSGELSDITCPADAASLAPGATVTCTASYTLTQADIDAGQVTNTATASGTPPTGDPVTSPPADAEVSLTQQPGISLVKSADRNELIAGDTIEYRFVVTNTGDVTLSNIAVAEDSFTGSGALSEIVCPTEPLAPGAQATCTATYEVTQTDVDAGTVDNRATASGTPPNGDPIRSEPSEVRIPQQAQPALELVKTADPAQGGAVGDRVTYSFAITNTGNVDLADVTVREGEFSGTGELSAVTCGPAAQFLAPGQTVICTAEYTLTQADVDAGTVTNTATAEGTPPAGSPVSSPPSEAVVPIAPTPGLTIVKSADQTELVAGDTVTYSFVVTNTGNVTLTNVAVTEQSFTGSGTLSALTCPDPSAPLAPGAQITCTATYEVTQADVDAGTVENSATATGTPPAGDPIVTPPSRVQIPQDPAPALDLVKTADRRQVGRVGDLITYSFVLTNVGNVTVTDATVTDTEFSGTGQLSEIVCLAGAASLLPGEQVTCTATYRVTAADLRTDTLTNVAVATATPPGDLPRVESPPSRAAVTIQVPPGTRLPLTGGEITGIVLGGAALLLVGGALLVGAKRRRRRHTAAETRAADE